jgi:L-threonylcarbamoyladenylate synthase
MDEINTEMLAPDQAGIARAVALWRKGGLVAFPTETVYGLGADACNGVAVAAIYAAKGRPSFNPLIIHVADIATARRFARLDGVAADMADAFWPGPLSLVLPVRAGSGLSPLVTAGLETVAVRVPENPLAQELLRVFGGAIAAPSANPSGKISPTSAKHVLDGLAGRIDAVMEGADCVVGLESTIVHAGVLPPALLRPGGLPSEAIEAMLGAELARDLDPERPNAPGQLTSHYAPSAAVRLNVVAPSNNGVLLGFGQMPDAAMNLSSAGDLHEAATNLFGMLHRLDAMAAESGKIVIEVAPIPDHGLGVAINDRLKRASAAR